MNVGPPTPEEIATGPISDPDGNETQKTHGKHRRTFKSFYKEEWTSFRGRRSRLFVLCFVIFLAALVASHVYFLTHPDQAAKRVTEEVQKLSQKGFFAETAAGLFLRILLNNVRATLIVLVLGLIPYLFLPAFGPLLNGGLIGVFTAYLEHNGFPLARAFWAGLAPHGVLEIPALLYAAVLGLDLAREMTRKMKPLDATLPLSSLRLLLRVLLSWSLIIVPLLTAAAAVEAFVTPALLGL